MGDTQDQPCQQGPKKNHASLPPWQIDNTGIFLVALLSSPSWSLDHLWAKTSAFPYLESNSKKMKKTWDLRLPRPVDEDLCLPVPGV